MPLHYFVGSAPQLSALLCWLVLCVCVNDYHCLKLTDNRDNSRKGWFGTVIVCHRQATSPVQNVVFKGLFQNSEPATVFCFFCLNLTGSKFINIFQGPLILILHIVSTFLSLSQITSHRSEDFQVLTQYSCGVFLLLLLHFP